MSITSDLIGEVGTTLYGPDFYEKLAAALNVDRQDISMWHDGMALPFPVLGDLMKVLIIASEARGAKNHADLNHLRDRIFRVMKYGAFIEGFRMGEISADRFVVALVTIGFSHGEAMRERDFYRIVG